MKNKNVNYFLTADRRFIIVCLYKCLTQTSNVKKLGRHLNSRCQNKVWTGIPSLICFPYISFVLDTHNIKEYKIYQNTSELVRSLHCNGTGQRFCFSLRIDKNHRIQVFTFNHRKDLFHRMVTDELKQEKKINNKW